MLRQGQALRCRKTTVARLPCRQSHRCRPTAHSFMIPITSMVKNTTRESGHDRNAQKGPTGDEERKQFTSIERDPYSLYIEKARRALFERHISSMHECFDRSRVAALSRVFAGRNPASKEFRLESRKSLQRPRRRCAYRLLLRLRAYRWTVPNQKGRTEKWLVRRPSSRQRRRRRERRRTR